MNHLGQLFLILLIAYGCSLVYRSRSLARKTKQTSLDYVAQIQTSADLSQTQKDLMVLDLVKTLGEVNRRNTLFGDFLIVSVIIAEVALLVLSFTV